MALTPEQLTLFKRPFPRADHEFLKEFVYLTEEAICNRIEEVDPAWTFELQRMERQGTQCVVCARLTICGVSREGVGMQQVNEKAGEPEKGSATDALKRCARLFGIGRYLLDAPDKAQFDKWLAEQQKAAGLTPQPIRPTPAGVPSSGASTAPMAAGSGDLPEVLYADVFGITECDRKDGKGVFYRLTGLDALDNEVQIVAFDTTALDLMGFDLDAISAKNKMVKGYAVKMPYTISEKDGKKFNNLDAVGIKATKQFEEV